MSKITLEMLLTDGGSIRKKTDEAKELNKELSKAKKLAGSTYSATSGSSNMSEVDYNKARLATGLMGAGAREFAAQSQGLNGLVRLYATWAANIYAAGAAFNALKTAANTDNMITGMNQLGVASGTALGAMLKRFVDATGGAISLKDAMLAAIKATLSGLSTKQFEDIGKVATKASRALGIDMQDAVSRLTRGITKLEPELLDELGIFTKVGTAADAYAKLVGKSAEKLTDFEKRQAFANAAIQEGLTKFGNIDVEANPYDKLLASIQNLTQKSLSLVNTVFTPIIQFLSLSPTALTGVLAGLGVLLLKQAIPALGEYKQAIARNLEEANKIWAARLESMKRILAKSFADITAMLEASAEKRLKKVEQITKKLHALSEASGLQMDERTSRIINIADPRELKRGDKKHLLNIAAELEAKGNLTLAALYRQAEKDLTAWVRAENAHSKLQDKLRQQQLERIQNALRTSPEGRARDQLMLANSAKVRSGIINDATYNASIMLPKAAWTELRAQVAEAPDLSRWQKLYTTISGGFSIATTAASRYLAVLGNVGMIVGVAVGALTALYLSIRSNSKELDELTKLLDYLEETFNVLSKLIMKFSNSLNSQSVLAVSNAVAGLAEGIADAQEKMQEFANSSNVLDKAWEAIKSGFGMLEQDAFASKTLKAISLMLSGISSPELKQKFSSQLKNVLNIDNLSISSIDDALESIDPKKLKELTPLLKTIQIQARATAATILAVQESFKDVATQATAMENLLKLSDLISNYANSIAVQAKTLGEAFKDPTTAATTFSDILKDINNLKGFAPEMQASILGSAKEYKELTAQAEQAKEAYDSLYASINARNGKLDEARREKIRNLDTPDGRLTYGKDLIDNLKKEYELRLNVDNANAKLKSLAQGFGEIATKNLEYAFEIALKKAGSAAAAANIEASKTILSYLPKNEATIKAQADLEVQSINIRIKEIQAVYELTNQLKVSVLEAKILEERRRLAEPGVEKDERRTRYENIALYQKVIDSYKDKDSNIAGYFAGKKPNIDKTTGQITDEGKYKGANAQALFERMQAQTGFAEQMAQLTGQIKNIRIKEKYDTYAASLDESSRQQATFLSDQKASHEKLLQLEKYLALSLPEQIKEQEEYTKRTREARINQATSAERNAVAMAEYVKSNNPLGSKEHTAAVQLLEGTKDKDGNVIRQGLISIRDTAVERATNAEDAASIAEKRANAEKLATYEIQKRTTKVEQEYAIQQAQQEGTLQALSAELQLLDQQIQSAGGLLLATSAAKKELELKILAQEKSVALAEEEARHTKTMIPLEYTLARIKSGEITSKDEIDKNTDAINAENRFHNIKMENIRKLFDSKTTIKALEKDETDRITAYSDTFKNAFLQMGDALADFARTGKLDFKGLIDSLIADLIRFEMQKMAMDIWTGGTKDGLGGLSGLLKTGLNTLMGNSAGPSTVPSPETLFGWAKGGAFTQGVEAFAQGGTFTNLIVSSPTLFKFAQGTGLMGEAGPEAIMPLKRDQNGTLGVRASQSNSSVEVVVNNYGSEQATTKETTDSRGNRKIEVVIGEMVAGEMARSGSTANKAVRGATGSKPPILRR